MMNMNKFTQKSLEAIKEAETLAISLAALPREVAGFDKVEWLIINDGSTDDTVKVAKECGVDYIVDFKNNQGLAKGFMAGVQECLKQGADVIVNTDAENQYEAQDIPKLVKPILEHKAEYVIGERPISHTEHFSPIKKFLQKQLRFLQAFLFEVYQTHCLNFHHFDLNLFHHIFHH